LRVKLSQEDLALLYKLRKLIESFTSEELKAFAFVWDNISVGEILLEQHLAVIHKIKRPSTVIVSLREKGALDRGEGCYNLPRWMRQLRKKIGSFSELRLILDKLP
jgi:hypothetical protein